MAVATPGAASIVCRARQYQAIGPHGYLQKTCKSGDALTPMESQGKETLGIVLKMDTAIAALRASD